MFLAVTEPEEQKFPKNQQILGNMFRAEFLSFPLVMIVGQPKTININGKNRKLSS
jgi:hypothetical protein